MISPSELQGVIDDIKRVGSVANLDPAHYSEDDDDQSESSFLPRAYDIDRLHADDARDKVFVAILKALVARYNKPSSPKELATCIMRHEFTMLGRAASADTTNTTAVSPMSSSRQDSYATPAASVSGASARPRRTSYDCGSLAKDSSADEHAETDSDTNPYARKRYKSVRSIVAQAYPRRRSRRQSGASSAVDPVATLAQPRTRRSASYNDANGGDSAARRVSTGAGKWRPNSNSGEDENEDEHGKSMDTKCESGGENVDMVASDGDEIDHHYGLSATESQRLVSKKDGCERSRWRRQGSDSASALGTATGRRRTGSSVDIKPFTPPPPNTTPRASASPDRTPYPPATSPSFHHLRRSMGDSDASPAPGSRVTRHKNTGSDELQIASPLLLPRGMVSLPLDGGSIFGTSSITDATLNVEPIAVSSSSISPAASLRHFTPTPVSTCTLEGMQTDETHVDMREDDALCAHEYGDKIGPCVERCKSGSLSQPKDSQKQLQAATTAAETVAAAQDIEATKSPDSVSVKTERSVDSTGIELSCGSGGFDFSFHDLMDAELMSLNELDKLWTNSNPMASSYLDSDTYTSYSMLEPIPEVSVEDGSDFSGNAASATAAVAETKQDATDNILRGKPTESHKMADSTVPSFYSQLTVPAEAAVHNNDADDDHSKLSIQLTQKLLALKAGSVAAVTAVKKEGTDNMYQPKEDQEAPLTDQSASEQSTKEPATAISSSPEKAADDGDSKSMDLDSVEPTNVLAKNAKEHEETISASSATKTNRVILPDPFADISPTAMVATKVPVSPRIVLTIVETVPVYMTVITTTEPAADCQGKWIVRRHRLLRLVENGYVNASSLLLSGGVASEQERSIVLSLEVGRFKWRRPQSKLYGTWIPLPRARALAATCSLNHRLGPFLNDNLESYFPAPLPTSFIRHLIMPFFSDSAGMLLSPSQSELDATSVAFSGDASSLLAKAEATAVATEPDKKAEALSSEAAAASGSAPTNDIMPVVSSHPVVTSTVLPSSGANTQSSSTSAVPNAASAAFGNGLGIGIQNMANSAMASYAQSLMRQPKQSISRSSTFGATARGTPSPSIIQSLATRGGGTLNFAGAAKAIFGSDDRQLQSFLQLLSAESPMLSTSIASELHVENSPPPPSRADSPFVSAESMAAIASETAAPTVPASASQGAGKCTDSDLLHPFVGTSSDPSLLPSPFGTKPEVKAVINDLAKSTLADNGSLASLVRDALDKAGNQAEDVDTSNARKTQIETDVSGSGAADTVKAENDAKAKPVCSSGAPTAALTFDTRTDGDVSGLKESKSALGPSLPDANAESDLFSRSRHIAGGVDQEKDADALSSVEVEPKASVKAEAAPASTQFEDSMDVDSTEQSDDDLDLRMVFSADDDDMDMICRSTPPSPPPPPHTPPRQRRLSSTPLLLSRSVSPCLSESLSSAGDRTLLDDQGHEQPVKQKLDQKLLQQQQLLLQQQQQQRLDRQQQHGIGSFNARLAQSMEAFGFTGTAKASLLLRLRAAAAAKSTGRQQAVAPYMLYRNTAGVAGTGGVGIAAAGVSGSGAGGNKRAKGSMNESDGNGVLAGGVRKRARVIRVPRSKPVSKQTPASAAGGAGSSSSLPASKGVNGVRGRNRGTAAIPDASVVLRLASAIYNHTLNLTALAHSQRQTAETHNTGANSTQSSVSSGSSEAKSPAVLSTSSSNSGNLQRNLPPPQGNASKSVSVSATGVQSKTPVAVRSPASGRSPVATPTPTVSRPLQRPSPRPSPQQQQQQQQQKMPFSGNRAVPPRSPAQQQQRPAIQRPAGGSPRPTLQAPRGQLPVRPVNGNRSPANVQRMPQQGMQQQQQQQQQQRSPRPPGIPSSSGAMPPQQRPMIRRPPLPQQQPRPRLGAPSGGPMHRPPGQQQRPAAARLPPGTTAGSSGSPALQRPPPPLLRSGVTGSPKQPPISQQQQKQKQPPPADTSSTTAVTSAATTPAVSINSAKTHKPQKAA
ncbi:hypothetical protein EV179_003619 [Coemansia sp. RSA 487]|nr:hypothetical protein EV179_003619 [Coemansia sp. RSA 487]